MVAYRARVCDLVRRVVRDAQHREDAEQSAVIGLLEALEKYDPSRAGAGGFWSFAYSRVYDEIRKWMSVGIYWRKPANRGKSEQRATNRERAQVDYRHWSLDEWLDSESNNQSASFGRRLRAGRKALPVETQQPTAEDLLSDAEEAALLGWFAGTLTLNERETLFSDDHRRRAGRHHKEIVARARLALVRKGGE